MRICNREVLAKDLNVVDGLSSVVVDMLFYGQNSLVLVRVFQLLWQFWHDDMGILIGKVQQLELKVDIRVWVLFLLLFLSILLLLVDH